MILARRVSFLGRFNGWYVVKELGNLRNAVVYSLGAPDRVIDPRLFPPGKKSRLYVFLVTRNSGIFVAMTAVFIELR